MIADLNRQFDSTLKTHEGYERQIAILENRIVELTSISDPGVLPTEWWNRFSS